MSIVNICILVYLGIGLYMVVKAIRVEGLRLCEALVFPLLVLGAPIVELANYLNKASTFIFSSKFWYMELIAPKATVAPKRKHKKTRR